MNCLCIKAKEYLKNIPDYQTDQIINFIDEFNKKIAEYSLNGLSSFVLECVGIGIKLSHSIGYTQGEILSRELRGDLLATGGYLNLAIESYEDCAEIVDSPILGYKLARAKFLVGATLSSRELDEYAILKNLMALRDLENPILNINWDMSIKDQDEYLMLCDYYRTTSVNPKTKGIILGKLEEYSHNCNICSIHLESLLNLPLVPNSVFELVEVAKNLFSRNHILVYIDFLLNASQVLIKSEDYSTAKKILQLVIDEKKDIRFFDKRIQKLSVKINEPVAI